MVVIEVIAGLLAGAVMVIRARSSTQVEIAASMELAQLLVSEAVTLMQQEVPAEKFLADLSSPLQLIRHVRIVVKDATGALLPMRPNSFAVIVLLDESLEILLPLPAQSEVGKLFPIPQSRTILRAKAIACLRSCSAPVVEVLKTSISAARPPSMTATRSRMMSRE